MVGSYPEAVENPQGGVEAAMLRLCEALDRAGDVDLTVLSLGRYPRTQSERVGGVHVIRQPVGGRLGRYRRVRSLAKRLAQSIHADIVHSQGRAVFLPNGLPSVLTIHGIMEHAARLEYSSWRLRAYEHLEVRPETRARNKVRNVISISPYVDAVLPEYPERRVWHIPNAVDTGLSPRLDPPARVSLLYSGFVGRRKGLLTLIGALAQARTRIPSFELKVIGPVRESAYRDACQKLAEQHGLSPNLTWMGPLPQKELWRHLRDSTALVLPSNEETAPMAIGEALSLGVPVIATDVGGIREMVPSGKAGFVVPPQDEAALSEAIATLLLDRNARTFRSRALTAGQRFSSDTVSEATLGCYREIVNA